MKEDTYCVYCGKFRPFDIEKHQITNDVHGIHFSYISKIARCKVCHNEVYVREINDANIDAAMDAFYKEKNNLGV